MKSLLKALVAGVILVAGCSAIPTEVSYTTPRQVVRMLSNDTYSCSGVVLSDALVLTAKHCEMLFKNTQVVKKSDFADLMLVRSKEKCPCVHIASKTPNIDDKVWVVGFPSGGMLRTQYVTEGRVQGYTEVEGERFMAVSAPSAPGNSGGAVLMIQDGQWVLVGVLVAGIPGYGHVALSVTYEDTKEFLTDYMKSK